MGARRASDVFSGEEYEAVLKSLRKGDAIDHSDAVVEEFVEKVKSLLQSTCSGSEKVRPVVYFQPGFKSEDGNDLCCVGAEHAFDAPELLAQCVQFLRYESGRRGQCD